MAIACRARCLDEIACYRGDFHERIRELGGKRPNPWRRYDVLGNVWDWCWDIYGVYGVLRG